MKLSTTLNETSFAVCIADVNALVLDALAVTGSARKDKFTLAWGRLHKAFLWAGTAAETALASGLGETIRNMERLGMDA